MTDTANWLTDTHREMGRQRIAAGEARTALLRRRYDAPIEDVWDACTDPDRLNRWFLQVTGDLRDGGTFSLAGSASGDILRCEPPRLLMVTWACGDRPADEVELRLSSARMVTPCSSSNTPRYPMSSSTIPKPVCGVSGSVGRCR